MHLHQTVDIFNIICGISNFIHFLCGDLYDKYCRQIIFSLHGQFQEVITKNLHMFKAKAFPLPLLLMLHIWQGINWLLEYTSLSDRMLNLKYWENNINILNLFLKHFIFIIFYMKIRVKWKSQAGTGQWTVNYTVTQSFIPTITYSWAQKLWVLLLDVD